MPGLANAALVVRPHRFGANPGTRSHGAFQRLTGADVSHAARHHLDGEEATFDHGVAMHALDDAISEAPDSLCAEKHLPAPAGGLMAVVYPGNYANRRRERRTSKGT